MNDNGINFGQLIRTFSCFFCLSALLVFGFFGLCMIVGCCTYSVYKYFTRKPDELTMNILIGGAVVELTKIGLLLIACYFLFFVFPDIISYGWGLSTFNAYFIWYAFLITMAIITIGCHMEYKSQNKHDSKSNIYIPDVKVNKEEDYEDYDWRG